MKLFHEHQWEIISKIYAPPVNTILSGVETNDMETLNRMMFGLTTIIFQCSICQKIRKEEMLGKEEEKKDD